MFTYDAECLKPPPALVALAFEATALVSQFVKPLPNLLPETCLSKEIPKFEARATPGRVWFSYYNRRELSVSPRLQYYENTALVLHEVLHQFALARPESERGPTWIEEGLAEAIAQDLNTVLVYRVTGIRGVRIKPNCYLQWVNRIRAASAQQTSTSWDSWKSKRFRIQVLLSHPDDRAQLLGLEN